MEESNVIRFYIFSLCLSYKRRKTNCVQLQADVEAFSMNGCQSLLFRVSTSTSVG